MSQSFLYLLELPNLFFDVVGFAEIGDGADEAKNESQADGGRGDVGGKLDRHIPAQELIEGRAQSGAFTLWAQVIPQPAGQEQEYERGQGQQRRHHVEQAGLFVKQGHPYPFNSSAVSTSTVV